VSRTLVLSLLRAGDALVHLQALAALRAAEPGGELHLLVQASAGPAVELLATQATVHRLPVDYLGGPLGPCQPLVEQLRSLDFDHVVNLTHRLFAAQLAATLGQDRAIGFTMVSGRPAVSSPWLAVLNDWGTSSLLSVLHYGDVACQSLGLAATDPELVRRLPPEAEHWWREARDRLGVKAGAPMLALQLTTSEPKKTYPPQRWHAFSSALAALAPGLAQVAIAGPLEATSVAAALEGTPAKVLSCSLAQAARLLASASLLVSGDTALIHLAGLVGTRVLLVSAGSSAFRELGPTGNDHAVVQSQWPCAPCAHDPGCLASLSGYPCTVAAEPAELARMALALLSNDALPAITGSVVLFRSCFDSRGLADFRPVGRVAPETACAELLREHLLERLPLALSPRAGPPPPARALDGAEVQALLELRRAVEAFHAEAEGLKPGAGRRVIPALSSPFALAFASAVAARLRETAPSAGSSLSGELTRLERRIAAALRGGSVAPA